MKFKVGDTVKRIITSNGYGDGRLLQVGDICVVTRVGVDEWMTVEANGTKYPDCDPQYFELVEAVHLKPFVNEIKDVIFNPPATIILWNDGTKSVVKCQNGEPYDAEKGFALAYLKKLLGNDNTFNKEINKWVKYDTSVINVVKDKPLTIEELNEMDGKQVYVVSLDENCKEDYYSRERIAYIGMLKQKCVMNLHRKGYKQAVELLSLQKKPTFAVTENGGKKMRLIDADALQDLEEMEYIYFSSPVGVPFYQANAVWDVIENAPTIEAEPVKHARWKKSKKEKMYCDWEMNGWFDYPEICTNCGYDATEYGMGVGNYCPNCGAKMDLEE